MPTSNTDMISFQSLTERSIITAYSFWDLRVGSNTLWWGVEGEGPPEADTHFIFIAGSLLKRRPEVMGKAEKAARRGREGEESEQGGGRQEKSVQASTFSHSFTHSFSQRMLFEHTMCQALSEARGHSSE